MGAGGLHFLLLERRKDVATPVFKYSKFIKEQNDKINQWISNRETRNTGAIGGRYEYRFFPTGIGTICKIVDTTDEESFTFRELN